MGLKKCCFCFFFPPNSSLVVTSGVLMNFSNAALIRRMEKQSSQPPCFVSVGYKRRRIFAESFVCHPRKGETSSMFVFTLAFIRNVFIKLYLFISRIKQQCTLILRWKLGANIRSVWKLNRAEKSFRCEKKNHPHRVGLLSENLNFSFLFSISAALIQLIDWVHDVCAETLPENGKATFHYEIVYRRSQFQSPIPWWGRLPKHFQFAQLNWLQFVRSNLRFGPIFRIAGTRRRRFLSAPTLDNVNKIIEGSDSFN